MEFEEKTLKSELLYSGRILELKKDKILLPNGKEGEREYINHGGGSGILCEKDGKVLLVKQFRYAFKEDVWEIPAGKINRGEDSLSTAYRELQEECGIKAEKMELLFATYPTPGYTNEITYIYRATGLSECKTELDEDEFLTAEWIEIPRLREMMKKGEIKDAKTIIALQTIL